MSLDKLKMFKPDSINRYINQPFTQYGGKLAPELRAAELAMVKITPPLAIGAALLANRDGNAVQDGTAPMNEFERGLATSAGIGALVGPLATAGIFMLGKGKTGVPLGPSTRRWLRTSMLAGAGGAVIGGGAYSAARGVAYSLDKIKDE